MHLPDGHGLGLLQRLRAAGHLCDVIAVTSARDADVVRHAVAQGVVLYLLKPFTFADLPRQARAVRRLPRRGSPRRADDVAQDEVDQLFGALRAGRPADAAEGDERGDPARRSPPRCATPTAGCRPPRSPRRSAPPGSPPAATWSTSPTPGAVERAPRYGGSGRPEVEYRWRALSGRASG